MEDEEFNFTPPKVGNVIVALMRNINGIVTSWFPLKWTKGSVFLLIKLYKNWDLLYDHRNHLYFNKLVRANVLESISKSLQKYVPQMTANEVKVRYLFLPVFLYCFLLIFLFLISLRYIRCVPNIIRS